ncbi:MAG: ATP-binding protein [Patescibacteria group bacterium]
MKKRLLFHTLLDNLDHKNALVITGMRQVGKTTVLKQLFDEIHDYPKLWFDFDNPLDQKIFEDVDYNNIYQRLQRQAKATKKRLYIFLDEIQNYPTITKVIKYLIDHYQVKFIVTGSSSFYLKNLFPESLSGRKFLYELAPLSFQEILYFFDQIDLAELQSYTIELAVQPQHLEQFTTRQELYKDYLTYGGFPEVVLTSDYTVKQNILKNIFTSFFEKDLKLLSDYKDIRELRDLILLLAPRVGSLLDISRIANELNVDRKKIYYYLEFLQATFFLRLLPKFSQSVDRAVAGGKKVYLTDTGLLRLLGQVNEAQVFENTVVNQLAQYGEVSFYNKRNTAEIDVILNKKIAFEVKTTATTSDVKKLAVLSDNLGLAQYYLVSKNYVALASTVFGSAL